MTKYSIIIPVYNSELIVENTINKVSDVMSIANKDFEIILINDNSSDNSWNIIAQNASINNNVIAINLLKNFGQHSAVYCGLQHASGDYLVTLDDDLQNPPEEILKLIKKIDEGYDLVFAKFEEKKHSLTRRLGSKIIGILNTKIFNKPKGLTLTNFRIFTRAVQERIINYSTSYPYIPGLLLMFSSNVANVTTRHEKREVGSSNYNLIKIMSLVGRLLFNYSSYPLKMLTFLGVFISSLSFIIGGYFLVKSFFMGSNVQGWTSTIVLLSFLNGFLILMVGILGEYVVRLMKQTSSTNSIIIKEIIK